VSDGAHQDPVRERDLIENEPRLKIVASGTATLGAEKCRCIQYEAEAATYCIDLGGCLVH